VESGREPLRVLLVEDERADAELVLAALRRGGFDVHDDVVGTEAAFNERLDAGPYDIVLADYRLAGWTGMGALRALKRRTLDTPFVLVTGSLGEERAVECLKEGAADYILKENLARLPVAVRRAIEDKRLHADRRRHEDVIRKLTLVVDQSPASVIITDTTGRIEYVNERFVQVTGYSVHEAIGQNPRIVKSGRTPPDVYHALWSALRRGATWRGEILNRRKDGRLFWDAVTVSPIRNAEGVVTHFVGMQEDITDRRRAQEELEASEARFRALAEASFDGIVVVDEGIVREANPGLERMLGFPTDEIIGRPVLDFVADESLEEVRLRVDQDIEGTYEVVLRRRDGRKLRAEATARILHHKGRSLRVAALRDITERRVLEDQLRQAQKMEAVGRLAGGIAHDFNNLITVITAYSDLLLEDLGVGDPRREDMELIRKAASDAAALTRQLLAFSRQQIVEPRLVRLEQVVTGAEKMLKRLIGEDVELVSVAGPEPATVFIDPGQLEQVLMNLVVNARDAMPRGGALTIEARVTELDDNYVRTHRPAVAGRYALLAVSDTGIGMDEETRARIFEPFFTTKEPGKGTGLGLATVYGIVKQNGGFIWVYSEPGLGSTFKVYLPLAEQGAMPAAAPAPTGDHAGQGTETVLLVEDSPAVRSATRAILSRYGYAVLEAPDSEVALRIAASHGGPIHLLLTDVVMPGASGRELAEQIARIRPGTKVLFMSGYTDDAIVRHGLLQSEIAFLQKPFSPEVLARKVRQVLDSGRRE
jgi:PAS domain S-box-containing protein